MSDATVVFAIDDAYCRPLQVALASLRETNPALCSSVQVVVIHEGLSAAARSDLSTLADRLGLDLAFHEAVLPELPYNTTFGGARANYLRLAIPDAVGPRQRVLYLDADIVVMAELDGLFTADLGGHPIGAVRDPVNPTLATGRALPGWAGLGLPGDREYFNSGVMLVDLGAAASDGLFERAFAAVETRSAQLRLWDQDALNLAADDRWQRLPRRWNTIPFSALRRTPWIRYQAEHVLPADVLVADEATPAILHYVSPAKPWRSLLPSGPANDLYQRYLRSLGPTRYTDTPKEES